MSDEPMPRWSPRWEPLLWMLGFSLYALSDLARRIYWAAAIDALLVLLDFTRYRTASDRTLITMHERWRATKFRWLWFILVAGNAYHLADMIPKWAVATGTRRFAITSAALGTIAIIIAVLWPWINRPRRPKRAPATAGAQA